ncbi:MAG: sodium:solute symporter family protein [Candidatus Hydrogenedentes bacterium]|nr:sodium:solute symporter family protein [Candidatus Hydrogenedentota bacterium]
MPSNFGWIDGGIVGVYLIATMVAGIAVRKYVGKVEDFLIAGREMNLYLGIASLAATEFGIVTCMYTAQNGYEKGFSGIIPGICQAVAMFVVGWTGFCVKPLRDSGAMTIPELFEKHFGGGVRWLAGVVIVLGGLLNMGVFLRVGGDFLIASCGISPANYHLEIMMTVLLLSVMVYTVLGGMLSVLVTDFLQFVVMSGGLLVVTILILVNVGWERLVTTVETHYGAGGFNPVANPDMGWSYVIFYSIQTLAAVLTWQTTIQRLLAAKDTKTGQKVYTHTSFFFVCRFLIPSLWGIAALAVLTPEIVGGNTLSAMPKYLAILLPSGLMGIMVAAMLAADMSTDSSYMLTWASVIYNDIMGPFRKKNTTEKQGILWSRLIVAAIGIFLMIYGLWYKVEGSLWDYLAVTGAIYLSSMSVLLVACCYWKRANDWGAYGAIILGAIIPVTSLVLKKIPAAAEFVASFGKQYDSYFGIAAFAFAAIAMVVGSLLKPANYSKEARTV